ncbi:MAG: hypothetical protein HGB11_07035 [Chlorobiales bacterium]|nr:hypothetical protein [Chlorobiales bacterium]
MTILDAQNRDGKSTTKPRSNSSQKLELYLHADLSFALCKPPGWSVSAQNIPNGKTIRIADPKSSAVAMVTQVSSTSAGNNSVEFATAAVKNMRAQAPNFQLDRVKTTNDRKRTVVDAHYKNTRGVETKARFYFFMDYPVAKSYGYEAPSTDFVKLQSTMMTILSNLTFLNQASLQEERAKQNANGGGNKPIELPMQQQRLSDGSASMLVPNGWSFQGKKGMSLCLSSDQTLGFSFSTAEFWGPSSIPYFTAPQMPGVIHHAYMKPVDALTFLMQQYGSSNFRTEQRWQNPRQAQEMSRAINRQTEAEGATLRYLTKANVSTKGFFEATTFLPLPSGQWLVIFWGVWAPEATFGQYLPTLIKMAASYHINEAWASNYIQQGLERLRKQMDRTQIAMKDAGTYARESNLAVFQEKMRSGDYIDYKRTSVIRGEQEWLSEAEGGVLYKSDHWGLSREGEQVIEGQSFNYYNYQGQNPRYNESMTPVDASREVYERVYGQGGPPH